MANSAKMASKRFSEPSNVARKRRRRCSLWHFDTSVCTSSMGARVFPTKLKNVVKFSQAKLSLSRLEASESLDEKGEMSQNGRAHGRFVLNIGVEREN